MNRLNLDDPHVFDRWRELYYSLTDEEQADFSDACERRFPHQAHADRAVIDEALERFLPNDARVLEVGGWKGELASHCLGKFPKIQNWLNVEFCRRAVARQVPMPLGGSGYEVLRPVNFGWFRTSGRFKRDFDVFISTHTIEHFSELDLRKLLEFVVAGIPVVILEAPITDAGQENWNGYLGTHILTMGWHSICDFMEDLGYRWVRMSVHCFVFLKEDSL